MRRVPHLTATWAHPQTHENHHSLHRDFRAGVPYALHVQEHRNPSVDGIQTRPANSVPSPPNRDWVDVRQFSQPVSSPKWNEMDFPPLTEFKGDVNTPPSRWLHKFSELGLSHNIE